MRRVLVGLLMAVSLGWAQPARKVAMVLKVQGGVSNQSSPVLTGQLWGPGDSIELAQGSQVTVLLLNRGERQEISGKGSLEVAPEGLKLHGGCSARELPSTQMKLALNGENHRQIAGMVLRNAASEPKNSPLDQIQLDPGGVKVSCPSGSGSPPSLQFYYLKKYDNPILNSDLQRVRMPALTKATDVLAAPEITGQKQAERWVWEAPWPSQGGAVALEVLDPATQSRQLYTRVHQPDSQQQSELSTAREKIASWTQQDPGTIGPSVYLANLLEEMGQLQAALEALGPALSLEPKDEGLVQMKARLLIDLGRYADAADTLRTAR
jgi:hypothetical protein